jgi:hypothetical protein
MNAQSIKCCQHGRAKRWMRGAVGGATFAILAALMPKCPMCIVAWLGVLGLSGLAAHVDARALWLGAALALAACFALLAQRERRSDGPRAPRFRKSVRDLRARRRETS